MNIGLIFVRAASKSSTIFVALSTSSVMSVSRICKPEVSINWFTLVGLPCWIVNQPSRASLCKTSRSVVRVTPISSDSSRSAGKMEPGGKRPFQMLSIMYFSANPAGLFALMTIIFVIPIFVLGRMALIIPLLLHLRKFTITKCNQIAI